MMMEKVCNSGAEYDYIVYEPKVKSDTNSLIVFLHGAGERGTNLDAVRVNGLPYELDNGLDIASYVVLPQCPADTFWVAQIESLKSFIDKIIEKYNIDKSKVCLAGISMGAYAAWYMGMAFPDMFAALIPCCGGGSTWSAGLLKDVPIWAFHGSMDCAVDVEESKKMVEAVNKNGGNAKLTIYEGVDHDSWVRAFKEKELYKWLYKII